MKKDRIGQSAAFVLTKWGYMDRNELFNLYVTQGLTQTEIGNRFWNEPNTIVNVNIGLLDSKSLNENN